MDPQTSEQPAAEDTVEAQFERARGDEAFVATVRAHVERDREILDRLAE